MAVIDGEFRRIGRKKKRRAQSSGMGESSGSLGTDIWEALNPGDVQTEHVIVTGSNNPNAYDNNPYSGIVNPGVSAPVLPQWLSDAVNDPFGNIKTILTIGIVLFFVVPALTKED